MKQIVCVLIALGLSAPVFAQTLTVELSLNESGELVTLNSAAKKDGWKKSDDGFVLVKTITLRKNESFDTLDYTLSFSDDRFTVKLSIGDADGGFSSKFILPKDANGKIIKNARYAIEASGGDYASGSWAGAANIKITAQ